MTKIALAAVTLAFVVAPILAPLGGWAGELHFVVFVVQDMEDGSAAWLPTEVILHKGTDLTSGVVFVLDNPTAHTHVFEAPGLFEQTADTRAETTARPLRVTVAPQETVHVQINVAQLEQTHAACIEEVQYRFFCPLHTADAKLTGTIRIVP